MCVFCFSWERSQKTKQNTAKCGLSRAELLSLAHCSVLRAWSEAETATAASWIGGLLTSLPMQLQDRSLLRPHLTQPQLSHLSQVGDGPWRCEVDLLVCAQGSTLTCFCFIPNGWVGVCAAFLAHGPSYAGHCMNFCGIADFLQVTHSGFFFF